MWSKDQYRSCVSPWLATGLGTLRRPWPQSMIKGIIGRGKARFAFSYVIKLYFEEFIGPAIS